MGMQQIHHPRISQIAVDDMHHSRDPDGRDSVAGGLSEKRLATALLRHWGVRQDDGRLDLTI
ncbi:MAG: hypothetical protein NVSMB10_16140 [Steroidobacteraceae bacterium]